MNGPIYKHHSNPFLWATVRKCLHDWLSASTPIAQTSSNSALLPQNSGNWLKTVCFKLLSSESGKPGNCLLPFTVHRIITSSPKNASFASFTTSCPALAFPRSLKYFCNTNSGVDKRSFFISEDNKYLCLGSWYTGLHCCAPAWVLAAGGSVGVSGYGRRKELCWGVED